MNQLPALRYSPAFRHLVWDGLTEILGQERLESLLTAMPSDQAKLDLESLRQVLTASYGSQSAAGILVRAGRAAFAHLLLKFAAELGFEDQQFRLLTPRRKMLTALQHLAAWLHRQGAGEVEIRLEEGRWQWLQQVDLGGQNDAELGTACPFTLGMLQELSYWASSGRVHPIHERPHPRGCLFEIEHKPLD